MSDTSWTRRSWGNRLQVGIILIGKGKVCGGLHLLAVLLELLVVDLNLGGSESGGSNELLQWGSVSAVKKTTNFRG